MNEKGMTGLALGLALLLIFLSLPLLVLAVVALALTIVGFRASPLPRACVPVCFFRELSPRSPPA